MPVNLNALIRYRTINSCLYGGLRRWSIAELIEACSAALAEARGRYGRISERTLRDDIRVLRSDILGFNAPIKQQAGLYFYTDPHYSIMAIGITDPVLIEKIIRMLLDIRGVVNHPELEIILESLMKISPVKTGVAYREKEMSEIDTEYGIPSTGGGYKRKPASGKIIPQREQMPEISESTIGPLFSLESPAPSSLLWGDILGAIRTITSLPG